MNTLFALLIVFAWCLLVWAVSQCLKRPTIHVKERDRR